MNDIDEYKDRMNAPIGAIMTGGFNMTMEMRAAAIKKINDFAEAHKTSSPCVGLICYSASEELCADHCPLAGYCKDGFSNMNEAEAFARHLIMTGYKVD